MKTNITKSILIALALIAIAPSANAQIASKEYVDDMDEKYFYGDLGKENAAIMYAELVEGLTGETMTEAEAAQGVEEIKSMGTFGSDLQSMTLAYQTAFQVGGETPGQVVTTTGNMGRVGYLDIDSTPTEDSDNLVTSDGVATALAGKMDTMTVDSEPTANSTNLVTSGGVATALAGKMDTMTVDSAPTANSTNLVTSGGVATAIAAAAPTVDATPTNGSNNPVSSDGVYDEFGNVYDALGYLQSDLDKAVGMKQNYYNSFMVTDNSGNVKLATGAYVTNDKVASNAAIEMGKIALPTPPAACDTYGCILMRYNNKYVWEMVTRNNGETISDTGGVNVAATATSNSLQGVRPVSCQMAGGSWDGTNCMVEK